MIIIAAENHIRYVEVGPEDTQGTGPDLGIFYEIFNLHIYTGERKLDGPIILYG